MSPILEYALAPDRVESCSPLGEDARGDHLPAILIALLPSDVGLRGEFTIGY
jgi:hypothetical protein